MVIKIIVVVLMETPRAAIGTVSSHSGSYFSLCALWRKASHNIYGQKPSFSTLNPKTDSSGQKRLRRRGIPIWKLPGLYGWALTGEEVTGDSFRTCFAANHNVDP